MINRRSSLVLAGGLMLGVACASGGTRTAAGGRARCGLEKGDTIFLSDEPVYRACAVDVRARQLVNEFQPGFQPPGYLPCYAIELEFVVDTMGMAETRSAHVLSTNSREFANAVIATLPQWKYEPARIGSTPVRQIVSMQHIVSLASVPAGSSPQKRPVERPQKC